MRFVANTQSPELGKMWEGDLKTKKEQAILDKKTTKEALAKAEEKRLQQIFETNKIALTEALKNGDIQTATNIAQNMNIPHDISGLEVKDTETKAVVNRYIDPATKKEFNGYGTTEGIMNTDTGKLIPNAVEKEKPKTTDESVVFTKELNYVTSRKDKMTSNPEYKTAIASYNSAKDAAMALDSETQEGINAIKRALVLMQGDKRISETDFKTSGVPKSILSSMVSNTKMWAIGKITEAQKDDIRKLVTLYINKNADTVNKIVDDYKNQSKVGVKQNKDIVDTFFFSSYVDKVNQQENIGELEQTIAQKLEASRNK
jgi:hypothetical protein